MALNLTVAMAQRGIRAVLIDADARGGDVATLCRLDDARSLADVLAGRCTVADALQPGPGGIRALAGIWAPQRLLNDPPNASDAVLNQLAGLADTADWVLVDAGHASDSMAERMGRNADVMVLVTTADDASVMDTYAAIKTLRGADHSAPLATLVNAVSQSADGGVVHSRIVRACRRFLGFEPGTIGHVESSPLARRAAAAGDPLVLAMPTSGATRQLYRAANNLCSLPNSTSSEGLWRAA